MSLSPVDHSAAFCPHRDRLARFAVHLQHAGARPPEAAHVVERQRPDAEAVILEVELQRVLARGVVPPGAVLPMRLRSTRFQQEHLACPSGGKLVARRTSAGRHDPDLRRTFRGLRLLPAQGQAGVPVEPGRPQAHQVGRPRGSLPWPAHAGVRLQVRRPRRRDARVQQHERPRPARHRHAQGGRQGGADDHDGRKRCR